MAAGRAVERRGYRDAMGEYVPAAGGGPLSRLSAPTPGPADYQLPDLNTHRPAAPAHLLVGRPTERRQPAAAASAASYDTRHTRGRHGPAVTLKRRLDAPDWCCSPGPVHLVTVGDLAQRPARVSLKSAPAAAATVGLPSPLDRGSVAAPAPVYSPVMAHLPAGAAFSLAGRPTDQHRPLGPGPAAADLRRAPAGPRYSLQGRPPPAPPPTGRFPGPGAYDPVPVGPACRAPVIGLWLPPRLPTPTPPPNAYRLTRDPATTRGPQMTFRSLGDEEPDPETPGPASYTPEKPSRCRAPAFTLTARRQADRRTATAAGPATYRLSREPSRRPAYSFGLKSPAAVGSTPAPNSYRPREPPGTRRGFPLVGRRPEVPAAAANPAPNVYSPRPTLPRAPHFPLGVRHAETAGRQQKTVPSPAAYHTGLSRSCTAEGANKPGASLKGRASRHLYNGFDTGRTLGAMSEHAERTRVIIC